MEGNGAVSEAKAPGRRASKRRSISLRISLRLIAAARGARALAISRDAVEQKDDLSMCYTIPCAMIPAQRRASARQMGS